MINNFQYFLFFLFCSLITLKSVNANEPFIFNVTEIEILENGNQINGYDGGTVISEDGSKIIAENFYYNKLTNILEAIGDVKYIDETKNIFITSDKTIYLKNLEKVYTVGNSRAINENNIITASSLEYDKVRNIFNAKKDAVVEDFKKDTIIYADEIIYLKNEEKAYAIGSSKVVNENNTITASNLEYDRIQNIFIAKENAVVKDFEKDTTIYADKITYLKNDEKLFTEGQTEALIEKKYNFYSENVSYLRNTEELSSQKKSKVVDGDGNIYELANFLYDVKKKLLRGEKVNIIAMVDEENTDKYYFSEGFFDFKNQSHIAKETKIKIHKSVFGDEEHDPRVYGSSSYSDANKTIINNGIFTSCKFNDDCPPWSIKAKKIIHDKIKRDMIYENAILKIYDFPVLYFPKFFHPDPSVKRRSGFLQPQLNNSDTLGSSLYVPYFKTLGHDMDLTFKPTLFEKLKKNFTKPKIFVKEGFVEREKYLLQTEFRKQGEDSFLIADVGFLRDYKSKVNNPENKTRNVNHLFLDYDHDLKFPNYENSRFTAQIERVTNETYLRVFQNVLPKTSVMPASQTSMNSNLKFYLDQEYQNLSTGVEIYESLAARSSDRYQYTFPYYDFSKDISSIINDTSINGSIDFYSSGRNTLSSTNNLRTTIVNDLNYASPDFISNIGFKNNFNLYFKNLNSQGKNDSIYTQSAQIDGMSILKIDTELPMIKSKNESNETLIPRISFRVNPGNNMDDYSTSSSVINANGAFGINRLGIGNSFEAGKSLTFGLDYKFDRIEDKQSENTSEVIKDKYFEFKLATVMRDEYEIDIPVSSTINRKNSNLFGSINNKLFNNVDLIYDFSLDNDMQTINSNSIKSEISINNFLTTFDYIEQRHEIGSTHILANTTEYMINENTSLKFATRRNKEINLTEFYDLSYEYKNDCLTAALKFNKTFYRDNDLVPTENLFFTITIVPLTTYEREIYKKKPGAIGLRGWFR